MCEKIKYVSFLIDKLIKSTFSKLKTKMKKEKKMKPNCLSKIKTVGTKSLDTEKCKDA